MTRPRARTRRNRAAADAAVTRQPPVYTPQGRPVRTTNGAPAPVRTIRVEATSVACPSCTSPAGTACHDRGRYGVRPHIARLTAARAALPPP